MHRHPLYHDVSPSKPIEFEDLEEPTPLALLKAIYNINETLFSSDALEEPTLIQKSKVQKPNETMKGQSTLPTNSLAAAVAAAKQRMEERDDDEQISMRLYERIPSDRQTYRTAHKQSLEWTQIMPHIWARGRSSQPHRASASTPALELEGVKAIYTSSSSSIKPLSSSPQLPLGHSSLNEEFEIRGSSIPIETPTSRAQEEECEEEVLASHGSYTETFAIHDSSMNQHISSHHASGLQGKKSRRSQRMQEAKSSAIIAALARPGLLERDERAEKMGLPPMEPSRNLLNQAVDLLMDRLWSKILPHLLPLVMTRIEARKKTPATDSYFGRTSKRPSGVPLGILPETETVNNFDRTSGAGHHRRNRSSGSHHHYFAPSPRTSTGGASSTGPSPGPGPGSPFKRKSWYDGIGGSIDESKAVESPSTLSHHSEAIPDSPITTRDHSLSPLPSSLSSLNSSGFTRIDAASPHWSPIPHALPHKGVGAMRTHLSTQHRYVVHTISGHKKNTMEPGVLTPLGWQQINLNTHDHMAAAVIPSPHSISSAPHKPRTGVTSPPSLQPIPPSYSSHVNQMAAPSSSMIWPSAASLSPSFQRNVSTTNHHQMPNVPAWLSRRSLPAISPSVPPMPEAAPKPFPFPSSKR